MGWPLATHAQQPAKVPRIGFLRFGPASANAGRVEALRAGLRDLGYVEGKNVVLEFRWAEEVDQLRELAAELVRMNIDVIFATGSTEVGAARQSTKTIPIVLGPAGDPVGTGLVASLAYPGNNITGLSGTAVDLAPKTLELIREVMPSAGRVAVLGHTVDPFGKLFVEGIERGARTLGIEAVVMTVRGEEELDAAYAEVDKKRVQAVIIQPSISGKRAADLALKYRLPAVSVSRILVEAGGLMSYSADLASVHREAAVYVDRILKGAKPADLPVAQPTKFEVVINLKTAKALGLTVPQSILLRADEIIE